MPQIHSPHSTIGHTPSRKSWASALWLTVTVPLLAACGEVAVDDAKEAAKGMLPDAKALTEQLPPEARAVVTSYKSDLRGAAAAYKAEYGQLPASFADIASVAGAREKAVNVLADAMAEQIPFASRETVEKAAKGVVSAAERQILEQMRTQDAPNQ